jgi:pilus assembly protein CpaF
MKGGSAPLALDGGDQFPPLDALPIDGDDFDVASPAGDAMSRLQDRMALSGDQGSSKVEGFEASIHRIKEQVLPRLLERVDPEAAATLSRTSSPRNSARSSAKCSPS